MTELDNSSVTEDNQTDVQKETQIGTDPLAWLEQEENTTTDNTGDNPVAEKQAESADVARLDLGQTLNIRDLDEFYQKLSSLLEQDNAVSLDVSQLEKVDAVSLQTLAAFYQTAVKQGLTIQWSECSQAFIEACELVGLNETLSVGSFSQAA